MRSPIQLDLIPPGASDDAVVLARRIERALRQQRDERLIHGYSVVEVARLMRPLPPITVPK